MQRNRNPQSSSSIFRWELWVVASCAMAALSIANVYNTNSPSKTESPLLQLVSSKGNALIMMNFAYSILFLFGKVIQLIFFGTLRDTEYKNMSDRIMNYILLKILFVGAMIDPDFHELLVWTAWFSILCFMRIFSLLTRDRFEYITTFNPNTESKVHIKLVSLLLIIVALDLGWFYFCFVVFGSAGYSILFLLTFECFTLLLDTLQTLIKYAIHLIDLRREGIWEQRGIYTYYTEFVTDTLVLAATLGHYLHILILHGVSFTLIDAILFLNMRVVFNNLREKLVAYRNYRKLAQDMRNRYPDVPKEELTQLDDVCAICHDKMESAKRLPCNHVFHHSCLLAWLENHHNCPTCRFSLIDNNIPRHHHQHTNQRGQANPNVGHNAEPGAGVHFNDGDREEIFRFNGQRWFSWLPTIQIVSERRNMFQPAPRGPMGQPVVPQELIQRVQEMFPHVPAPVIANDLLQTNSVEMTIENLLEGRVVIPQQPPTPDPQSQQPIRRESPFGTGTTTQPSEPVQDTSPVSNVNSVELPKFADSFATTPQERQQRLVNRKQAMLEIARKQYLEKKSQPSPSMNVTREQDIRTINNNNSNDMNDEIQEDPAERRRRLLLEAAQRRAQNNNKEFESKKDL